MRSSDIHRINLSELIMIFAIKACSRDDDDDDGHIVCFSFTVNCRLILLTLSIRTFQLQ